MLGPLDPLIIHLTVVAIAVLCQRSRRIHLKQLQPAVHGGVFGAPTHKENILCREMRLLGHTNPVPDGILTDDMQFPQAGEVEQPLSLKVEQGLVVFALKAEALDERRLCLEPPDVQGSDRDHVDLVVDPGIALAADKGTLVKLLLDGDAPGLAADVEDGGRAREAPNLLQYATLLCLNHIAAELYHARLGVDELPDTHAKLSRQATELMKGSQPLALALALPLLGRSSFLLLGIAGKIPLCIEYGMDGLGEMSQGCLGPCRIDHDQATH